MSVIYYRLVVAYDGTNFLGWQEQPVGRTVQGVLKSTFKKTFEKNCSIVGASRTDTGVHAKYQTVRINTELDVAPEKLKFAWGNMLPRDLVIKSVERLDKPAQFHPQHNILKKTYHYDFYIGQADPILNRTALHWTWPLDIKKLEQALPYFVGTKDFRSFCTSPEEDKDTVRTVDSIRLLRLAKSDDHQLYRLEFKGKSFLHHMIRRIVGAFLEVSSRPNVSLDVLQKALDKKDPNQTLLNAPARGLMLYDIKYKSTCTANLNRLS